MTSLLVAVVLACSHRSPMPAAMPEGPAWEEPGEEAAAAAPTAAPPPAVASAPGLLGDWGQRASTGDRLDGAWRGVWAIDDNPSQWTFVTDGARWSVSAVDTGDGEAYEVADLAGDGETVRFHSRMPSTGHTLVQSWTMTSDGVATVQLRGDAEGTVRATRVFTP